MPSTDPNNQYPPNPTGYPGPIPDPPQPAAAPMIAPDDEAAPIQAPDKDDL